MLVKILPYLGLIFVFVGYFMLFIVPDETMTVSSIFLLAIAGMSLSCLGAIFIMIYLFLKGRE